MKCRRNTLRRVPGIACCVFVWLASLSGVAHSSPPIDTQPPRPQQDATDPSQIQPGTAADWTERIETALFPLQASIDSLRTSSQ